MSNISRPYLHSEAEILRILDDIEALLGRQRKAPTYRQSLKLGRQIESVRASLRWRLCSKLGLRPLPVLGSPRNWIVPSLEPRAIWCEQCGFACGRRDADHGRGFAHHEGFSKVGEARKLHTVMVHSVHQFERITRFAPEFNLHAQLVGWSWYGPEYTAALITRRANPCAT